MARFEMHEVADWDDLTNAGDYMFVSRSATDPDLSVKGARVAVIVCPKCLRPGSCSAHTMISEKPLTIRASYLCGQPVGGPTGTDGS
jgi:hypothetical protein